jgi:hypothetical protein
MATINEVELRLGEALSKPMQEFGVLPPGYRPVVRLHGGKRDKRRSAAFERNWSPDTDSVRITFELVADGPQLAIDSNAPRPPVSDSNALSDLIRTLDRAESRPGYEFVSLKWFRDNALEGFSWAADEAVRQTVLRDAIDRRLILTHKVANPRAPQFPTTAIRLNRLMSEVKAALGKEAQISDFQPVSIRGEALSTTALRGRR